MHQLPGRFLLRFEREYMHELRHGHVSIRIVLDQLLELQRWTLLVCNRPRYAGGLLQLPSRHLFRGYCEYLHAVCAGGVSSRDGRYKLHLLPCRPLLN